MKEEFNLSKCLISYKCNDVENFILIEDVKEFIKRLKEEIIFPLLKSWEIDKDVSESVITQINKLAGEKLNGN